MNPRDDRVDDRGKGDVMGTPPKGPTTLGEEAELHGWQAADEPSGATARPMTVAGTRGASTERG